MRQAEDLFNQYRVQHERLRSEDSANLNEMRCSHLSLSKGGTGANILATLTATLPVENWAPCL